MALKALEPLLLESLLRCDDYIIYTDMGIRTKLYALVNIFSIFRNDVPI